MLLSELDPNLNTNDVDFLSDLHFFMVNDPAFYRKVYFPCILRLKDMMHKDDQSPSEMLFRKCVNAAIEQYCKKFDIVNSKSVFTDVDRDQLARKIFSQEKENIANGHYDHRKER